MSLCCVVLLFLIPTIYRSTAHIKALLQILCKLNSEQIFPMLMSSQTFLDNSVRPFRQLEKEFEEENFATMNIEEDSLLKDEKINKPQLKEKQEEDILNNQYVGREKQINAKMYEY